MTIYTQNTAWTKGNGKTANYIINRYSDKVIFLYVSKVAKRGDSIENKVGSNKRALPFPIEQSASLSIQIKRVQD